MEITELTSSDREHSRIVQLVDHALVASDDWRRNARRRRQYRQGDQWTEDEIRILTGRKEPIVTDNLIHDKVTSLQGMEQAVRTDPKAYPRKPGADDDARLVTNALRYVEEQNRIDQQHTRAGEFIAVEGTAAFEVVPDKRSKDPGAPDIKVRLLHPDRLITDPHSRELDFSDSRFIGYERWADRAEIAEEIGEKAAKKLATYRDGESGYGRDELENQSFWYDAKRDRVRIVHLYYKRGGQIYYCEFQRFEFVKTPVATPYRDDRGQPLWPIIARSAYIKDNNERHGEVERYIDPQNEINKRRSKSLHLLNTQMVTHEDGAFDDDDLAREELKKPDGMLRVNDGYFDKVRVDRHLDLSASHQGLLALALSRFEDIGANSALMGTASQSGRSLQVQQQAGSMRLGPHFDALDDLKLRTYRAIWNRIKQFWTAEKWIRVQDENEQREAKFVAMNQAQLDPDTGAVSIVNRVQDIDADIVIDSQPDIVSLRQEQFEKISAIPGIPLKYVIQASDLRNRQEILDDMEGSTDDPQAQAAAQLQQVMQQLQIQLQQLEVAQAAADVKKTEKETEKLDAEADRIEIEGARQFYGAA